jgi:asparagine synthase (glutamine-hydrolysing)
MCGIAGIINLKGRVEETDLISMGNAIHHRGPDDQGFYINKNRNIGFAHRRLSFIDLSEKGRQPLCNEDRTVWITFNGEIYNFRELKKELQGKGHRFVSDTDTEVLVHAYEEWKENMLSRLVGMWAFAIWDEKNQKLFAARDRFGIKPFYFGFQNERFVFASEIKAIAALEGFQLSLNRSAIADFLNYRFVPSPKSIWSEINKLPPAYYLVFEQGTIKTVNYWHLKSRNEFVSLPQLTSEIGKLLENSVKQHAVSDVPIGAFLSGGYDSSAIAMYLNKMNYPLQTFSIGFTGWENSEHHFAEMVARQLGSKHISYIVEDAHLELLDQLAWVYDEPLADISTLPTFMVSRVASQHVKAVMSGEGSDEIFVGYNWQRQFQPKGIWAQLKHFQIFSRNNYIVDYYAESMAMGRFDNQELKKLLSSDMQEYIPEDADWFYRQNFDAKLPPLKAIQQLDRLSFMGELVLTKIDRASMANSLEVRVPFLHHELFEKIFSLDVSQYHNPLQTKWLLYQQLKDVFSKEILQRSKQGFVGPDRFYQNMEWYKRVLSSSNLVKDGIFNQAVLHDYILTNQYWKLWKIVVLEKWYQKWIVKS